MVCKDRDVQAQEHKTTANLGRIATTQPHQPRSQAGHQGQAFAIVPPAPPEKIGSGKLCAICKYSCHYPEMCPSAAAARRTEGGVNKQQRCIAECRSGNSKGCSQCGGQDHRADDHWHAMVDAMSTVNASVAVGAAMKGKGKGKGKDKTAKGSDCFICGGDHYARDCPQGGKGSDCFICGGDHYARDCPQGGKGG